MASRGRQMKRPASAVVAPVAKNPAAAYDKVFQAAMPSSAWESQIVPCAPCKSEGCKYRGLPETGYCCERCRSPGGCDAAYQEAVPGVEKANGSIPANGCQPHCREEADCRAAKDSGLGTDDGHEAGCSRLPVTVLQDCWWETFRCDGAFDQDAECFVAPPADAEARRAPAPVILFLTGNGHVDGRQDFFWGGVDVLLRNEALRRSCFVVAPRPTSTCGLLRYNDRWQRAWAEDAVWALFTEVLRRLGPARADAGRLCVTGLSLGASGVWHLALRYGQHLAAAVPISGHCDWPGDSWRGRAGPAEDVLRRLARLDLRAYQIDVDTRAGTPIQDVEWLCYEFEEQSEERTLPGMDPGKSIGVTVRRWLWKDTGAKWELWIAAGPLQDWSAWDDWGGDKHCLWHRIYPSSDWGLADFLLGRRSLPEEQRWRFDSPPLVVDTTEIRRAQEEEWRAQQAWSSHEAKKPRQTPPESEDGVRLEDGSCPAPQQDSVVEGTDPQP